jgi:maleylpyruvate isomerase
VAEDRARLFDYWRSTASWRVRIALNYKGLPYESVPIDLRIGEQSAAEYHAVNPQNLVPTLQLGDLQLSQSAAILEYLEEVYPDPPLLPEDPAGRAIVRRMMNIVVCDIHPINNLRVLTRLRSDFRATEAQVAAWIANWIGQGFEALNAAIDAHGGGFAYCDAPTFADLCLVPQVYSARRFEVDLAPFPRVTAVADRCASLDAFASTHPDQVLAAQGG